MRCKFEYYMNKFKQFKCYIIFQMFIMIFLTNIDKQFPLPTNQNSNNITLSHYASTAPSDAAARISPSSIVTGPRFDQSRKTTTSLRCDKSKTQSREPSDKTSPSKCRSPLVCSSCLCCADSVRACLLLLAATTPTHCSITHNTATAPHPLQP